MPGTNRYRKVPLNDNSNINDIEEGEEATSERKSWIRRKADYIALHLTILAFYCIATVTIVTQFGNGDAGQARCPISLTYSITLCS